MTPVDPGVTRSPVGLRRAARLIVRGMLRRCPNCGAHPIFDSLLELKASCPSCGLRLERGESDYFIGAYLLNLVAVELLFAMLLAGVVVATWPSPPWKFLEYAGGALVLTGAIVCYPLAKGVWLAFDLIFRPVTRGDMQ